VRHLGLPDWLKERRLELGLPAEAEAYQSQRDLLLKGALVGVVLALSPMALVVVLGAQQRRLDAEVLQLAPVEASVGNAEARLKAMAKQRGALEQQTKRIAAQLVALRSGSALLEQIREVTPQGVRLLSVVALPSKLIIKGEAEGADALERINALALNLEAQEELLTDGTSILKATANDKGLIDFSVESAIDPSVRATPERLRELGSEGLARRYELLREQGIAL
tara:strand:+ start:66 stop:737 length:672 start_codon:yes stop_codon:yes gene_type:complete